MEDDFDIMDHQVEDNADLGAAVWIRGEAMALDEARVMQTGFECGKNWVKPLDVADLEGESFGLRERNQCLGMFGGFGDRFFDEHMLAGLQEGGANREMKWGWCGNGGGIHRGDEIFHGGGCAGSVHSGHLFGGGQIGIIDAREFLACNLGQNSGVEASDVSGSDDSDATTAHDWEDSEWTEGAKPSRGDIPRVKLGEGDEIRIATKGG